MANYTVGLDVWMAFQYLFVPGVIARILNNINLLTYFLGQKYKSRHWQEELLLIQ